MYMYIRISGIKTHQTSTVERTCTLHLHVSYSAFIDNRLSMCIYLHTEAVCVCFVDDLYLHNIMLDCAREQKSHGGAVDRCGQQNAVFVTLVGPMQIQKIL